MKGANCPLMTTAATRLWPSRGNRGQCVRNPGPLGVALLLALLLPASQALALVPELDPGEVSAATSIDEKQTPTQSLFVPLVSQPNRIDPDTRFAIQLFNGLDAQVTEADQVGAGRVRMPFIWAAVERTNTNPDEFQWYTYDQWLLKIAGSGMDLILTVDGNPTWAATYSGGPIDKAPIGEFVEFVVAAVERYSAPPYNVKLWEFYNEPDNGDPLWAVNSSLGYWGNEPEAYAEMLAAVYGPLKQADPASQVLLGGIAFDFWPEDGGPFVPEFLDGVLQAGGGDYFDVMNFHYYPTAFAHRWSPYGPGLIGKATFLRDKLASYGLHKPMICTEAGVENVNTGTDEIQSRYIPILYVQTMAGNLMSLSWFMLVDQDPGYWKTGLLYADMTRKPAYYAYKTATSRLGESTYISALSTTEKGTGAMEAYRFLAADGQKRFTVAWTNDGLSYPLAVTANRVL
ncbi:MAG TPA: cellulase family glycosylhydrolase, partial [Anaerolineae bacterium]|nr:cellulase family glycosylhydrolase [Anaerolineae bacterium]